jgi:hypothetical protein
MRRLGIAGCLIVTILSGICVGQTTRPDQTEQLLEEVRALRAEVKDLRAQLNQRLPATQPAVSAAAVADTSAMVMHDAERRSHFLEMGEMTAGYVPNKGFIIRSEDGNFLMHPWMFIQVRNVTNYREPGSDGKSSETQNGFEIPRMKLIFDGNVFSPDLTYQFIWATSDTTGNLGLQDAWARYHFPKSQWAVQAGQIRDPVDHEQIMYATRSLTPERSIVNNVLLNSDNIVKGADVAYGYDLPSPVRFEVAITDGMRNFDTNFQDYPTNPANWGAAGRVEWKLAGNWKDYEQFTALGDEQDLMVLGGGVDYTEAGAAGSLIYVGDVQYDAPSGLMIYAAYLGRYTRDNSGPIGTNGGATSTSGPPADTYDSTVRVMAAYLIDKHFEPFARYEYLHIDPHELPATAAHDEIHDITLGFNYYFHGHRAKISAAASYLPIGSPIANNGSDLLVAARQEVIIQVQFQIII